MVLKPKIMQKIENAKSNMSNKQLKRREQKLRSLEHAKAMFANSTRARNGVLHL